jgi:FdhE protein
VPAAAGRLFEQIAAIFLADPSLAELVEPIMVAVRSHRLHVEQLVSEALVSHSDHLTTLARAASVDRTLLGLFADLTSRPLLAGIGGRLRPALRLGAWEQRYCPICGAHPLSGETVIPDSRLRCSRCATAWAWDLLRCPACEQGIMTSLNADLHVEGRSWTVSGCDDCRTYLKIAASGSSGSLGQLMADDLATWRLDRAAVASGYQPVRVSARRLEHGDLAGEELDDD